MRKVLIMLLLSGAAYAQGGLFNDVAFNSAGRPAPGATVHIGTSSCTGTPCSPAVTVYSDAALTTSTSVTADANGNFSFYAVPNFYKVQVTYLGSTYTYTVNVASPVPTGRIDVNAQAGSTLGAKIIACIAALPSTGGVCDASGISGAQSITSNIWAGNTKPVKLLLGNVTITDSSCWTMPNDGAIVPRQPAIQVLGVGIDAGSTGSVTPLYGTIIDNSCPTSPAKVVSLGVGVFEMHGVTWRDTSGGSNPFMLFTNTIPKISDNQFFGSKNGVLCDQDAIILGGTSETVDGTVTGAFQGYGGYIQHNFVDHIRRIAYARTFVNNFPITENVVWSHSGSNLVGGAAIEFLAGAVQGVAGNQVVNNLIEVTNYPYGIKFSNRGTNNVISGNGCFDPVAGHLSCTRFENTSTYNMVIDGYRNDSYPGISEDAGSLGANTFITSHQSQVSTMPGLYNFNAGDGLRMTFGAVGGRAYNNKLSTTNDEFYWQLFTSGGVSYQLTAKPAGGAEEQMFVFRRLDGTQYQIKMNSSVASFLDSASDMKIRAAGGGGFVTWIGTTTALKNFVGDDGVWHNTVATATAPLVIASTTPVANLTTAPLIYNHSGTQITGGHEVLDVCTLGTDCSVTLTGSAVYTSSSSYVCAPVDKTAIAAIRFNPSSGSAFALTGTGTDVLAYRCTGN